MKKHIIVILFLFTTLSYGQYEAGHWFFGEHAGVNFLNSSGPIAEPISKISTEEGCSSISTPCGDLVLYTDGITVWNAKHEVMSNGTGLKGDDSSTQSALIVPKPKDLDTYYIFTVNDGYSDPSRYGVNYSIVDMTLDGGFGEISQKNIPLIKHAGEKITAVATSDYKGVWVVVFAPKPSGSSTTAPYDTSSSIFNTFYAFKITNAGVETTAVISTLSIAVAGGAGYMKISPDGKKLAIANTADVPSSAYIFDFDNSTGKVTNPIKLDVPSKYAYLYGLEFSPDGSKLYLANGNLYGGDSALMQFDLNNDNKYTLISELQNYRSALQLALNGKIYQTHTLEYGKGTNEMSVIENPNAPGTACNYNYLGFTLPANMVVHQGLPPFIQSFFTNIKSLNVTANVTDTFELLTTTEITSVDWDFGDGTTDTSYPDNAPDKTHTKIDHLYSTAGTYTVDVVVHLAVGCDVSLSKLLVIPEPFPGQRVCKIPGTNKISVDLHDYDYDIGTIQEADPPFEIHYYKTRSDALNQVNELPTPFETTANSVEIYYAVYHPGSSDIVNLGKFNLIAEPNPIISNVSPLETCDDGDGDGIAIFDLTKKKSEILGVQSSSNFEVAYYSNQTDAESAVNEIIDPTNYLNVIPNTDKVWYTITNTETSCKSISSFDLLVHSLPEINMEDTYSICEGELLQIEAPAGFSSYLWSTGDTTQSITVKTASKLTLIVSNQYGCTATHHVEVFTSEPANIESIRKNDFHTGANNSFEVTVSGLGDYEYSIDGLNYQDSNIFKKLYPGTYTVYVSDKKGCGVTKKEVILLGAPLFFTPNGDGFNDYWQVININKYPGTKIYIYDRYGRQMATLTDRDLGWDGNYNGNPALATDYWYIVNIKETNGKTREVRGHFTLKR